MSWLPLSIRESPECSTYISSEVAEHSIKCTTIAEEIHSESTSEKIDKLYYTNYAATNRDAAYAAEGAQQIVPCQHHGMFEAWHAALLKINM